MLLHGWQIYAQVYAGSPFLSHSGKQRPQLWHAAGKSLPPAIGREDRFLFFSAMQEIDWVCKKDLHHKVMENSPLAEHGKQAVTDRVYQFI